jgi:formylglycine-generating enzyme required for sulfatase activity
MIEDTDQDQSASHRVQVFISYSRKDKDFVDQLEVALKARNCEPLVDRQDPIALQDWSKGIAPFEDWWKRIETLIGKADTIVFVLSPDAVASKVALKEVEYAASLNKRFAPVVCRKVNDTAVPEALQKLAYFFFDDVSRFDTSADHLAAALQINLDWIRKHSEYGETARRWTIAGRPGHHGLLLRSPTLEEAERWIASRPQSAPAPTEETVALVSESRRTAIWRRRRIVALASAAALVVVAGLVAWREEAWLNERLYAVVHVHPLTPKKERALKLGDPPFKECTDCPEMVLVPAGSFLMGSSEGEGNDTQHPQHEVAITFRFAVSKFALTFAEWDVCAAHGGCASDISDRGWGRVGQPVVNVDFDDAQHYVAWLTKVTGRAYRLLTEAEYEYATRAGTQTAYPWGNDIGKNNANCVGCGSKWDGRQAAPVGSFGPNGFGLHDMVGNVFEWVFDCMHENYDGAPTDGSAWIEDGDCVARVARGGSWGTASDGLRSAHRAFGASSARRSDLGFRVVRTLSY